MASSSTSPRDGITKSGMLLIQSDSDETSFCPCFCELTDTEWTAYDGRRIRASGEVRRRVGGVRLSKLISLHIEEFDGALTKILFALMTTVALCCSQTAVTESSGKACLVLSWAERNEQSHERRYRIQALSNETELQLWRVAFLLNLTRGLFTAALSLRLSRAALLGCTLDLLLVFLRRRLAK